MSNKRNTKKGSSKNDSSDNRHLQSHHPPFPEHHDVHNPMQIPMRHEASSKRSSDNPISQNLSTRHINNSDPIQGNSWRKKVTEDIEQHSGSTNNTENTRQSFLNEIAYNQGNSQDCPLNWHSHRFQSIVKNTRPHRDNNFSGQNTGPTYYEYHSQHQQKHNYSNNNFIAMCDQAFLKLAHQRNQASSYPPHSQDLNGNSTALTSSQPYIANYLAPSSFETNQYINHPFTPQPNLVNNTNVYEVHSISLFYTPPKHIFSSGHIHKQDYNMNIQSTSIPNFPGSMHAGESSEVYSSLEYNNITNPQLFIHPLQNNALSLNQSPELHHSVHTNNQGTNSINYSNQSHNKLQSNSHHYPPLGRNNPENSSQRNKSSTHLSSNSNISWHSEIYHESQSDEHISREPVLSTPSDTFPGNSIHQMNRSYSYSNNPSKSIKNSQSRI